jgi:hypothetical protein
MLDMGIRKVELWLSWSAKIKATSLSFGWRGNEYSFAVKKNPPRVEIVDEEAIPPEFNDYTPSVNKAAIKSALEDGKEVPGAELVQTTRLDVLLTGKERIDREVTTCRLDSESAGS